MIDLTEFEPLGRHEKIALSFSGGKDSLACLHMLRKHLDRIVVYHLDTGDLLPEIREIVDHAKALAPKFVHLQTSVFAWQKDNGLPTDLMPHSADYIGQQMGEGIKLAPRYACCAANLMLPLWERIKSDGNTLLIRGTKAVDMKRLPVSSGEVHQGVEVWYPLQDWTHAQVMSYLRAVGAPICRVYETMTNAPECARCTAWWGEGRAAYLKRHHPELWLDYMTRLAAVHNELKKPLMNLQLEFESANDA